MAMSLPSIKRVTTIEFGSKPPWKPPTECIEGEEFVKLYKGDSGLCRFVLGKNAYGGLRDHVWFNTMRKRRADAGEAAINGVSAMEADASDSVAESAIAGDTHDPEMRRNKEPS